MRIRELSVSEFNLDVSFTGVHGGTKGSTVFRSRACHVCTCLSVRLPIRFSRAQLALTVPIVDAYWRLV